MSTKIAKTRRVIAEFAPGHLYNPIFVQAIKLPGGGIEVAAKSRIVVGPGISARVIAGSAKSQVKALRVFAAELSSLGCALASLGGTSFGDAKRNLSLPS